MARKKRTVTVVSINSVKCDGTYHYPGEEWECPHDMVGVLEEVGAAERIRVIEKKVAAPKAPLAGNNDGNEDPAKDSEKGTEDTTAQDKDISNDGLGNK